MFTEVLYTCEKEGFVRYDPPRRTFLGKQDDLIKAVAANTPTLITDVFRLGDNIPCMVASKQGNTYVVAQLPNLILNTIWGFWPDGKSVSPIGQKRDNATDFAATFKWTPPETMKLWFIMMWDIARNWVNPFLVATPGKAEFYKLPLPNIFTDCRMCMGDYRGLLKGSLQERAAADLAHLQTSSWNTHLINESSEEFRKAMFKFSADGVQRAIPKNWIEYCYRTNNDYFNIGLPVSPV